MTRPLYDTLLAAALALALPVHAEFSRSRALRADFMRSHPCPSTGATKGACPGYQVDHREALVCGGRDELENLQWLSIEEHRAKTRVEVKLCRARPAARQALSATTRETVALRGSAS